MKTHRVCFLVTHHSDDMKCNFSPKYYSKASKNHQIGKNDHKVIKVRRKMLRMLKKVVVCWDILCRKSIHRFHNRLYKGHKGRPFG